MDGCNGWMDCWMWADGGGHVVARILDYRASRKKTKRCFISVFDKITEEFTTTPERADPGRTQRNIGQPSNAYDHALLLTSKLVNSFVCLDHAVAPPGIAASAHLEMLKPNFYGIAKGKVLVTSERENMPTIRLGLAGTRVIVCMKMEQVLEFMIEQGVPGAKPPQVLWRFMRMATPEVLKVFLDFGNALKVGIVSCRGVLFTPPGWIVGEQVGRERDWAGLKVGYITNTDFAAMEMLRDVFTPQKKIFPIMDRFFDAKAQFASAVAVAAVGAGAELVAAAGAGDRASLIRASDEQPGAARHAQTSPAVVEISDEEEEGTEQARGPQARVSPSTIAAGIVKVTVKKEPQDVVDVEAPIVEEKKDDRQAGGAAETSVVARCFLQQKKAMQLARQGFMRLARQQRARKPSTMTRCRRSPQPMIRLGKPTIQPMSARAPRAPKRARRAGTQVGQLAQLLRQSFQPLQPRKPRRLPAATGRIWIELFCLLMLNCG